MDKQGKPLGSDLNRAKLFIVDDHPIVRDGFARLIGHKAKHDLVLCGEADNAANALKGLATLKPDLVVVDVSLRGCDGIELTKNIRSQYRNMPILILSMHDESLYAERALQAGANGYIMKNEPSDTLLYAIRKILDGGVYVSDSISSEIIRRMRSGGSGNVPSAIASLSDRELEAFGLIGRGNTTRQCADELCISVKTVETYLSRIKLKLNLHTYNELIVHAALWVNGNFR
jgi:DNA-binding NarL/FixJ family response regulator